MNQKQTIQTIKNNNLEGFKKLLSQNNYRVHSRVYLYSLYSSVIYNRIPMVELLLENKELDPSNNKNYTILKAFKFKRYEIIDILWSDQRVKDTLKNDDFQKYKELIQKDIQQKIKDF
jgi:hypothetical protein